VDTEKVCARCGKHCVPVQSNCPKCGSLLPAATPVTQASAPPFRPHKVILNKGTEERILECGGEEQAFDEATPWVVRGYIARIVDEHGVVKWTQALSKGQPALFQDDVTERRPASGAQATGSQPRAAARKPWWRFW
jgi:hypothetical protein